MNDFQKFLDEKLESIQLDNGIINGDIADSYDIYQEIRDAITALRHDNHMTQKDLASRTGLTQANISNLEKGSSKPTIETLKKIADATFSVGDRTITFLTSKNLEKYIEVVEWDQDIWWLSQRIKGKNRKKIILI